MDLTAAAFLYWTNVKPSSSNRASVVTGGPILEGLEAMSVPEALSAPVVEGREDVDALESPATETLPTNRGALGGVRMFGTLNRFEATFKIGELRGHVGKGEKDLGNVI